MVRPARASAPGCVRPRDLYRREQDGASERCSDVVTCAVTATVVLTGCVVVSKGVVTAEYPWAPVGLATSGAAKEADRLRYVA